MLHPLLYNYSKFSFHIENIKNIMIFFIFSICDIFENMILPTLFKGQASISGRSVSHKRYMIET